MNQPWTELGIPPTQDKQTIRRAYAQRLKQAHPEDHPEAFQRLREAYEFALQWASWDPEVFEDVAETAAPPAIETSAPPAAAAAAVAVEPSPPSPFDQAASLVGRVLDRLQEAGEAEAILEFERILGTPDFETLEVHLRFERGLQYGLIQQDKMPYLLLERLATEFQWSRRSLDLISSNLAGSLETWQTVQQLRQATFWDSPFKRGRPWLPDNPLRWRAAIMLTGPCRPWGFRLNETLFPGLAEAVQVLLRHFRDMSSTSLFDFLDPSTVEWWEGRRTQHLTPFAITGIFSAILLAFVAGTGLGWKAWALPTALSVLWWFGCTFLGASVVFASESRWVRFRRALQFIATSPVITRKYKPQTRWRNLWWLAPTAVTVIRLITLPSEGAVGTLQIIVLVGALAAIIVWLQKK